jgi:hypothetical protein
VTAHSLPVPQMGEMSFLMGQDRDADLVVWQWVEAGLREAKGATQEHCLGW